MEKLLENILTDKAARNTASLEAHAVRNAEYVPWDSVQ